MTSLGWVVCYKKCNTFLAIPNKLCMKSGLKLKRFIEKYRVHHFQKSPRLCMLYMLYPLSLPHGNDEFYDHHQISSATFLMQSLLNAIADIISLQATALRLGRPVWHARRVTPKIISAINNGVIISY